MVASICLLVHMYRCIYWTYMNRVDHECNEMTYILMSSCNRPTFKPKWTCHRIIFLSLFLSHYLSYSIVLSVFHTFAFFVNKIYTFFFSTFFTSEYISYLYSNSPAFSLQEYTTNAVYEGKLDVNVHIYIFDSNVIKCIMQSKVIKC